MKIFQSGVFVFILYLLSPCVSTSENVSTATPQYPPVELQDIGFDGTWEQFCDREKIDKEFSFYSEHELRVLRYMICDMRAENQINIQSMSPFIVYKYCEMMRFRADEMVEKLVARLTDDDEVKKDELLGDGPPVNEDTDCYRTTTVAFGKICVDEENPYFRMFKPLLSRACTVDWLTTDKIVSYLDEVCVDRKMSGKIDWQAIIRTVPCRLPGQGTQ